MPDSSVAVQVTTCSPRSKVSGASLVTVTLLTVSVAFGADNSIVLSDADVASWVMSAGAVITGLVVSCTVTFWVAVEMFPEESVAVQVTVVSPNGKDFGASFGGLERNSHFICFVNFDVVGTRTRTRAASHRSLTFLYQLI